MKRTMILSGVCGVFLLAVAASVPAQEAGEAPVKVLSFQAFGDSEGGAPLVIRSGGDFTGSSFVFPSPDGFAGGFTGGVGMGGYAPADEMGMLGVEQIQNELELVPGQKERLTKLRKSIDERRREAIGDLKSVEPKKLAEKVRAVEAQVREDVKQELTSILLPHQVDRLKQLRLQMQVRNRGLTALSGSDFADALSLTDEQKTKLAEKQTAAAKQLREKVEEIRRQLQKDVLGEVLTAEQREKLSKLTGADFQLKPVDPPRLTVPAKK